MTGPSRGVRVDVPQTENEQAAAVEVREEFAVRITWPDGRAEVWPGPPELMQYRLDYHNDSGKSACTAEALVRTVTTVYGGWATFVPAPSVQTGEQP